MKTIKATDHISIVFGEWFDKHYGNTYYDALIRINGESFEVAYQYGYNAGGAQSVNEALAAIGYRLRTSTKHPNRPYRAIHISTTPKRKRELYK